MLHAETLAMPVDRIRGFPIAAAILAGMVAMSVANILPLLVGVVADRMGLNNGQAGLIAAADIAGLTVGSVICTLLRRRSLRVLGIAGLALLATANAATISVHGFELLAATRFVAGFGGGFALAICYAVLGAGDQARDFAIFNVGQIAIGWIGMLLAPSLLSRLGWQGLFMALAMLAAVAALFATLLPLRLPHAARMGGSAVTVWRGMGLLGICTVASVLIYFTGQGGVWAYLDRMGAVHNFAPDSIARALTWCMFAGMAASLIATWLDVRLGLVVPLLVGFLITMVGLVELWLLPSASTYLLATCVFVFGWNLIVPYQFATVAKVDMDGILAMLASTASVAGLALGPAIASPLAERADFGAVRLIALVMDVVSLAMLVPALRYRASAITHKVH